MRGYEWWPVEQCGSQRKGKPRRVPRFSRWIVDLLVAANGGEGYAYGGSRWSQCYKGFVYDPYPNDSSEPYWCSG